MAENQIENNNVENQIEKAAEEKVESSAEETAGAEQGKDMKTGSEQKEDKELHVDKAVEPASGKATTLSVGVEIVKRDQYKKWILWGVKILFLAAVLCVYIFGMREPWESQELSLIDKYEIGQSTYSAVEHLSTERTVVQKFEADSNYLYKISILFYCYNDSVGDGELYLNLSDSSGKIIWQTEKPYEQLVDGIFIDFDVNTPVESGEMYTLSIAGYSSTGALSPAVWGGVPNKNTPLTMQVEGEDTDNMLLACFEYRYMAWGNILLTMTVFFCIMLFTLIQLPDIKLLQRILTPIALVVFPYLSFCLVESLFQNPLNIAFKAVVFNYLIYLAIYLIAFAATNRVRWAVIIGNTLTFLVGVANYYVLQFRGTPICPWDLMSLGTATTVVDNYVFEIPMELVLKILLAILINVLALSFYGRCRNLKERLVSLGTTAVYAVVLFVLFIGSSFLEKQGFVVDLWMQASGYIQNGYVLSFVMNMQYLNVEKPEGYSVEAVKEILEPEKETVTDQGTDMNPNIIIIMNEAFSDLTVVGDFETNIDYMSHIHELEENTIKGNLYVSIFGGGTCNSEYEVLTGNSMAYLASNSIAYQQYISGSDTTGSIVSSLKALGYDCTAIHPMDGSNWNRENVYGSMGFDEFYDKTSFRTVTRIRGSMISDWDTYNKIIEVYEEKEEGKPMFAFDVTVQNHGGYSGTAQFDEKDRVQITSGEGDSVVEEYLSLIKISDDAFAQLLEYFSEVEEPTMIVMFGDHQPMIGDEFYERMKGKPLSEWTLEEMQQRYMVPFVLWTNYDIEVDTVEAMSANYLPTLIFEYAGLPMPKYFSFQQQMYEELPVINSIGYMDAEGNWYSWSDESPYEELLMKYRYLHYNSAIDKDNSYLQMYNYGK